MIYLKYFVGNQKLVRISHGKRAIGVRATEIRLYILSAEVVESIWQIHRVTNDDLTYAIEIQEKKINDVFLHIAGILICIEKQKQEFVYLCLVLYSKLVCLNSDLICLKFNASAFNNNVDGIYIYVQHIHSQEIITGKHMLLKHQPFIVIK